MQEAPAAEPSPSSHSGRITGAVCAAMLLLFAILSYSSALTKSPTSDEPLHALGGYLHRVEHDFRIDPEDPPLFGYWAAIPQRSGVIKLDLQSKQWRDVPQTHGFNQWEFTANTLFNTPGNDGDRFIQRSRFMFTIVGVALGALIAWWSWRLAGAAAAIIATTLFALDPSFLAHASLVKNDVPAALMMLGVAMALWRFGITGSAISLAVLALTCAVGMNVKFSGVLCGPIVLLTLVIRALMPMPWRVLGFELRAGVPKALAALVACSVVALTCYVITWASYGFRFAPTKDPQIRLNIDSMVDFIKSSKTAALINRVYDAPPGLQQSQKPGLVADAVVWAEQHRLMPQAWATGFLYTYATTFSKPTFLLGTTGYRGVWYYFPLAMLFKTPTATLVAGVLAAGIGWSWFRRNARHRRRSGDPFDPRLGWTIWCIAVPVVVYLLSALTSGINIGVRHMLPVYPFIFVTVAIAVSELIRRKPGAGRTIAGILLLGLAVESVAAYPDYLAFFNTPAGGKRGGIRLLGDSNLDWGQDLKLLAKWQRQHPDKKLYLAYFGTVFPPYYGIDAITMPGGLGTNARLPAPDEDCYIAISATNLQGMYLEREFEKLYVSFKDREPAEVLGGSIYIFQSSPRR